MRRIVEYPLIVLLCHSRIWCSGVLLFTLLFTVQVIVPGSVQAKSFRESQIKAVFLFNLTKFVTWPTKSDEPVRDTFSIGILGMNPFSDHLEKVINDEMVMGRGIALVYFENPEEVDWQKTDLLFIGADYLKNVPVLSEFSRQYKVLTVGDIDGFCQSGGMVNLLKEGNRIKIEVNMLETRKSGFQVSAQVLKLARVVNTSRETGQ